MSNCDQAASGEQVEQRATTFTALADADFLQLFYAHAQQAAQG